MKIMAKMKIIMAKIIISAAKEEENEIMAIISGEKSKSA